LALGGEVKVFLWDPPFLEIIEDVQMVRSDEISDKFSWRFLEV
jgi:hypothetical protein